MAWEPSLVKHDDSQLGCPGEVMRAISRAFSGLEWQMAPGGEGLVRQMEQCGVVFSDDVRATMLHMPPSWEGVFDTQALTVEFNLGPSDEVRFVNVTSRGEHSEAQRRLRALALEMKWVIKGDYDE